MVYHVMGKDSNEIRTFQPEEINDMDYDLAGRVIIFGNDGQVYYLLADASILS